MSGSPNWDLLLRVEDKSKKADSSVLQVAEPARPTRGSRGLGTAGSRGADADPKLRQLPPRRVHAGAQ